MIDEEEENPFLPQNKRKPRVFTLSEALKKEKAKKQVELALKKKKERMKLDFGLDLTNAQLKSQENVWARRPCGNEKNTLANRNATLQDLCITNLYSKALTSNRELYGASEAGLTLKAKMFACIREIEKNATTK